MTIRKSLFPVVLRRLLCAAAAALAAGVANGQQRDGQIRVRTADVGDVSLKYHIQGDAAIIGTGNGGEPAIPSGTDGCLILPSEIDGFRVRRIGPFAFSGCSRLEEVVLPASVHGQLALSHGLFSGCRSLRRVVFPERFYLSSWGGRPGTAADILHGCDALKEVVFMGGVPEPSFMERLGVSLNDRLRFTDAYAKQWKVYAEDNGITGWKMLAPESGADDGGTEGAAAEIDFSQAEYASGDPAFAPLVKLAANFCTYLKSYDDQYEKSCRELDAQLRVQMAKNKDKCQASGDLDAVMAYEEALKSDQPVETEVESLKALYAQRAAAETGYRKVRDEKQAKAAAVVLQKIEEIKVKETKAGNIAYAKEAKAYGDRVSVLAGSLQKRVKAHGDAEAREAGRALSGARAGSGKTADVGNAKEPAETPGGPMSVPGATAFAVSVGAGDDRGALIGGGNFEKGDLLVIQYAGGMMSRYSGGSSSFNPDKRESHYYYEDADGRSPVRISGPDKARNQTIRQLPHGTEQAPYVFEIPEAGRYRLTCFLGRGASGKASYQVLRVMKYNAQKFKASPQAKQCQW